jgi:hypothetical protein
MAVLKRLQLAVFLYERPPEIKSVGPYTFYYNASYNFKLMKGVISVVLLQMEREETQLYSDLRYCLFSDPVG